MKYYQLLVGASNMWGSPATYRSTCQKSRCESRGWKIFNQILAKLSWRQGSSTCGASTSQTQMKCINTTISISLSNLSRSRLQSMFLEMYVPLAVFGLLASSLSTGKSGGRRSCSPHIPPLPFCLHISARNQYCQPIWEDGVPLRQGRSLLYSQSKSFC